MSDPHDIEADLRDGKISVNDARAAAGMEPSPADPEALLREVSGSGVEFVMPGRYVVVQIDTRTWAEIQGWRRQRVTAGLE